MWILTESPNPLDFHTPPITSESVNNLYSNAPLPNWKNTTQEPITDPIIDETAPNDVTSILRQPFLLVYRITIIPTKGNSSISHFSLCHHWHQQHPFAPSPSPFFSSGPFINLWVYLKTPLVIISRPLLPTYQDSALFFYCYSSVEDIDDNLKYRMISDLGW